jgi:Transposase domain (DUF772)
MSTRHGGSNRQSEFFARSMCPAIAIDPNHRLVRLTDQLDWDELQDLVEAIRSRKLKNAAGRPPHLRALIGVVVLRATRKMTYRETEDQVRYHAPARYLCALTETDWTPDTNTIHDFEQLLGEDGLQLLNEYVVKKAVDFKLADPSVVVADTTAQEAAIPYPNEMGLMASFLSKVASGSAQAGGTLRAFGKEAAGTFAKAKKKFREYRLFAKDKAKATKDKMTAKMVALVEQVQKQLGQALKSTQATSRNLHTKARRALNEVALMHETMKKLTPQIRFWLRTGFVATKKVVSLHMPEVYTVVRGKVGKKVEFGLQWGITRLRGGFLLASAGLQRGTVEDQRYAVQAARDIAALFGSPPRQYAYDRGGDSDRNLRELRELGVKDIALAPRGRRPWQVSGKTKDDLVSERAQVEGGIGAIKSNRYGFNRPMARSVDMMAMCGQRAVLGFNLNKLVRELAKNQSLVLVG